MNQLDAWLTRHIHDCTAPLFAETNLRVETVSIGALTKLRRHPPFDALMIETVEQGLAAASWQGIAYVMHWRRSDGTVPLYVGKTERRGVKHEVSGNIRNIRANTHKFGRWGYGIAYHIGDLSHAMLGGQSYKTPDAKYRRWAQTLFTSCAPPQLRERVYVALISWHTGMRGPSGLEASVAAVEKEVIALASASHPDLLLNVDGR